MSKGPYNLSYAISANQSIDIYLFYQYDFIKWTLDTDTKPKSYIIDPTHFSVSSAILKTFIVDVGRTCDLVIYNPNDASIQVDYVVDMIHYSEDPKTVALVIILPLGKKCLEAIFLIS
jgi:hypothetical protein